MRKLIPFVVLLAVPLWLFAQEEKEKPKKPGLLTNQVRDFMRLKLDHSKEVLDGLTTEDYKKISKNAQSMSLLSQASNWQVLQTPEYLQQSREFQRLADELAEAGRDNELDRATLAYVQMTMKCVACHKYVRSVALGQVGELDGDYAIGLLEPNGSSKTAASQQ